MKSGHNMSINSAVDRISTWWLQLYYEWKYRKVNKIKFIFKLLFIVKHIFLFSFMLPKKTKNKKLVCIDDIVFLCVRTGFQISVGWTLLYVFMHDTSYFNVLFYWQIGRRKTQLLMSGNLIRNTSNLLYYVCIFSLRSCAKLFGLIYRAFSILLKI